MKTLPCPDCGRAIRPCNMKRHRRGSHLPKFSPRSWGTEMKTAKVPLRVNRERRDRRYDDLIPRGEGPFRYRIYRLRAGDLQLIGTAETAEKFGEAIADFYERGEFIYDDAVGVLDTANDPGGWVIHPWALGRRPTP